MVRLIALIGLLFLSALALSGCATLSKAQCQAGDWRGIGYSDGAAGRPIAYIRYHNEACADYGVSVDTKLYEQGRAEGLTRYCTLDTAEREGRAGRSYHNVCTGRIGDSFRTVYRQAHDVYEVRQQIEAVRSELDSLYARLSDPKLSKDDKAAILSRIRGVQLQLDSLHDDLRLAEHWLDRAYDRETRRLAAG